MIASAVRTPIGSFRSSLCSVPAPRLGAIVVKAAVEKAGTYCTGHLTVCLSPGWPHGWCTGPQSGGLGLSPGQGYCVVFLSKTLNYKSASLHLGV